MDSKVGLGDIRGLLVDSDKRPVLRLLPDLDEVSRGYALSHLGDAEAIAKQVWVLNATDWLRGKDEISWNLYKTLAYNGFSRVLHEFALKITEDFLVSHKKQGGQVLKESWELLLLKRRWMEGEILDEELDNARTAERAASRAAHMAAYWAANRVAHMAAYWVAYWAAYMAAYMAADGAADWAADKKKQVELLADILEDSVGIERGVEGKSLESKVLTGGL